MSATASPSGNKYYSLYVCRWEEGNLSGLVNEAWADQYGIFTMDVLNGGTATLKMRSEVAASLVTLKAGTALSFEKIN